MIQTGYYNIIDAANFIIELYAKEYNGCQYRCTLTKIEKLLSIADFIFMKNTATNLFNEKICINPCGTGFPRLSGFIPSNIGNATLECNKSIEDTNDESDSVKRLIKDVFLKYGAYESVFLGKELIDSFKVEVKSSSEKEYGRDVVEPELVKEFFDSLNLSEYNGDLQDFFKYIIEYQWIVL